MEKYERYGPSLPPPLKVQTLREPWMDEKSYHLKSFELSDRAKEVEDTDSQHKINDHSSPGLHIMKNSQKRLFMDTKNSELINEETDYKIKAMKKRFKSGKQCKDASTDKSFSKNTKFMEPKYDHPCSIDDSSRIERKFISPHPRSNQGCNNEGNKFSNSNKKSRSRSPRENIKSNDCSKDILLEKAGPSSTRIDRKISHITAKTNRKTNSDKGQETKDTLDVEQKIDNVTNDDLNKLSAKILKAEIVGDSKKAIKLKKKMEVLKKNLQKQLLSSSSAEKTIILTTSDLKGNERPINIDTTELHRKNRKTKHENLATSHDSSGSRINYFADDNNKKGISSLLQEEKSVQKLGHDQVFMKYAGKLSKMANNRQNWTIDDMFESSITKEKNQSAEESKRVIAKNKKYHKQLECCQMCLDNCSEAAIVYIGDYLYVRVPPYKSLTKYHCQIVPINHIIASVNSDEEFQEELKSVKIKIVDKLENKNLDVVFLESAQNLHYRRHIFIDCIPIPKDEGSVLPAFFKKAILDCDLEWAQNKKLIDTRHKTLFKSVPKGLSYFSVEFGKDGGFAHVIEEERLFKPYFGLEIIGSALDCDVNLWRHPEKESPESINYKKKKFEKLKIFSDSKLNTKQL